MNFTGGYTADNKELTSSTKVTADITVCAGWHLTAGYVEVTYIINDEAYLIKVYEAGKISEPEVSIPQGKELHGWYTDKELQNQFDFNSEVTNNLTLYAKLENSSSYLPYILAALIIIVFAAVIIWYLKK